MYKLVIIPEGSSLPEDLQHLFVQGNDIIEKIAAGASAEAIVSVNTRELQMLVEYRDLFDCTPIAIIGMQGAMYNTVWNTYVATMERTTLDAYRVTLRDRNDDRSQSGTDAIVRPTKEARIARLHAPANDDAPDENEFGA